MDEGWPELPYDGWRDTLDTLHAHTQVLGKLAVHLAPAEPQWQHAALRLTARGWETAPLPSPTGQGALVVALDLRTYEGVVEHSANGSKRIPLTPNRSVREVTRDVLSAARALGGRIEMSLTPQETSWKTPLDEDDEHATFNPKHVDAYFAAATSAAKVLTEFRAPYRGRSTPVNAWWGSFDLAVSLFSGRSVDPPSNDLLMRNAMDSEEIAVGWWPGDDNYRNAAFYAYAHPAPPAFQLAAVPPPARWAEGLGEFLLDWDAVGQTNNPHQTALEFARSIATHGCQVCAWDPALAASLNGTPPPIA